MSGTGLWTEEQFNCPVCLDLPSEPVTIPCGHSYCMACIADYWKSEGQKGGAYSCPECRQTFKPCPQLCRNTIRAARSASARAAARTSAPLPPSAVPCDRCTEPRAALKTCLVCMASLCETHLKPHQTKAKLKGHELIGPTGDLSQKICPHHKYLQEFHCRTCQKFVCWICTSNQHKGHETVSTQTERTEKQVGRSSDTVKAEADTVLLELQHSVQRLQQLIQDVMSSTGQEKLSEAQDMVDKLEAEIKQLKKKDTELKNLVSSEDNIYFLKVDTHTLTLRTTSTFSKYTHTHIHTHIHTHTRAPHRHTGQRVPALVGTLILTPLSVTVSDACALTLDPNTAHQRLALMEEGTRAELQVRALPYPECPQRFDGWTQVLCLQPLVSERSYWEVEWRGRGSSLGVASAAMTRKGADARAGLGYNSQSWSLELSDMCCAAMHANQKKEIPVTYCPRVGVFLDRGAGTLSFYAVDDNLLLVHEFRGSFSEPLFAAFGVGSGVGG
uniref:Tripartite motif containing 25, like n=1 Tax=Electrophorus electricus TaxID=8005 RepID=A0AAY5EKP4_ELEEL